MTEVVSVRFKNKGKVYYFDPNGLTVEKGMTVIVETSKGLEYAKCTHGNHEVQDNAVVPPLRPIIRIATPEDDLRAEENHKKEEEAFVICNEKIAKHGLDMKLVDVEYNFEGSKILFFFISDGRVDFRELVKDLAAVFKTRIELRQIGVRDEARMLNGLGICGRPFCCAQFLDDFQPVSIKMAKTQGLSLNPTKISGTCGRLMCCLKYEQEAYEELVKLVPKVDSFVETPLGKGMVTDVNLLRSKVRVRLEDQSDTAIKVFDAEEVEVLGGKAARAEYLAAKAEGNIQETEKTVREKKQNKKQQPVKKPLCDCLNGECPIATAMDVENISEENVPDEHTEKSHIDERNNKKSDSEKSAIKVTEKDIHFESEETSAENLNTEIEGEHKKQYNRRKKPYRKPKQQGIQQNNENKQLNIGGEQHRNEKRQNNFQRSGAGEISNTEKPVNQNGEQNKKEGKPNYKRPFKYRRRNNKKPGQPKQNNND